MPKKRRTGNYTFNSYWCHWSRVLLRPTSFETLLAQGFDEQTAKHLAGSYVEVDITPINGWERGDVDRIRSINIRVHMTIRREQDVDTNILPGPVRSDMEKHLGEKLTRKILSEDFLSQINWTKHSRLSNGGCSFERCKV